LFRDFLTVEYSISFLFIQYLLSERSALTNRNAAIAVIQIKTVNGGRMGDVHGS
jgi:hypothetical protein